VGGGLTQEINVPNIASSEVRRISVTFNDFVQPANVPFRAASPGVTLVGD
jgi:hypothetical protein